MELHRKHTLFKKISFVILLELNFSRVNHMPNPISVAIYLIPNGVVLSGKMLYMQAMYYFILHMNCAVQMVFVQL